MLPNETMPTAEHPALFNRYTGQRRDDRDVASDPDGFLIVPPGANIHRARTEQRLLRMWNRAGLCAEAVALMREFCRRVDAGEVHSRKTYAQFKVFIAKYEESQNV